MRRCYAQTCLGSSNVWCKISDGTTATQRYYVWGAIRSTTGTLPTDYAFTGQRLDASGLLDYNARWYDPALARFVSADSIVPQPGNPQSLSRYSYVLNCPARFTDPTGHMWPDEEDNRASAATFVNPIRGEGQDEDRSRVVQEKRDYRLSLRYPGSGPNGSWTAADWAAYYTVVGMIGDDLLYHKGRPSWLAAGTFPYTWVLGNPFHAVQKYLLRRSIQMQSGPDGTIQVLNSLVPPGTGAITFGEFMFLGPGSDTFTEAEEYVHVLQYRHLGIRFGEEYASGGFWSWGTNMLEVQAVNVRTFYLNRNLQGLWLPPWPWQFPYGRNR